MKFLGCVFTRFVDLSVIKKAIHLSTYWLLSMTTRATPLSAISITQEASYMRVLVASFSSLLML